MDFVFIFSFWGKEKRRDARLRYGLPPKMRKLFPLRRAIHRHRRPLSTSFAGQHHSPVTEHLWRLRQEQAAKENDEASSFEVDAGTGLLIKSPATTRTLVRYDFSANNNLLDKYRNPWGYVRHGLLIEDLDALAGNTAAQHCADGDPSTPNPLLVTASVDSIRMKHRLDVNHDLVLTGSVAWVGRSSMLINMMMEDVTTGKTLMEAGFTFVARCRETHKSVAINRLAPETPEEQQLFDRIEAREIEKKRLRQDRLHALEEKRIRDEAVHHLLMQSKTLLEMPALVTDDVMLMSQTRVENSMICQPQQRNMADSIFGGFLMRRAFELAFSTCYLHGGSRPHFLELERVIFRQPVQIGDLLRLAAHVTYTTMEPRPLVHIEVLASVVKPEQREAVVSNIFNFTFALNLHLEAAHNRTMKAVVPATEGEARKYLNGEMFVQDNLHGI